MLALFNLVGLVLVEFEFSSVGEDKLCFEGDLPITDSVFPAVGVAFDLLIIFFSMTISMQTFLFVEGVLESALLDFRSESLMESSLLLLAAVPFLSFLEGALSLSDDTDVCVDDPLSKDELDRVLVADFFVDCCGLPFWEDLRDE